MHDSMTVAFEIRYPWVARRNRKSRDKFLHTYHDPFITIWHCDPETDGTDDSCDWFGSRFTKAQEAAIMQILDNPDDNIQGYFGDMDEYSMRFIVTCVARFTKRLFKPRPWWQHPRWHVWHWRLQVHPYQRLRRWLFTRCATCGKRFDWNESPCALGWHDRAVHHMRCVGIEVEQTA